MKKNLSKKKLLDSKERCKKYRLKILEMSQNVSALHLGGSFSCIEIFDTILNIINSKTENFILSKGHVAILNYILLKDKNILKEKHLKNYCKKDGILGVHPIVKTPGITASTGSLGHGLGIATGLALANKNQTYYTLLSDGELQEGSTWEAIMAIPNLNANNMCIIIDNNDLVSYNNLSKSHSNMYPIEEKLISFGWDAKVCDGHKVNEIYKSLYSKKNKPLALIAKTIKGYPVSFMSNKPIWHYRSPNKEELEIAIKDLN